MHKGKRKMKALAVMCTALALGATTTGAMFSSSVWNNDTAIVASASESVTFSAEKFGFGANSKILGFNLVKGISLVGTYNANQFLNGVTANVSEGTEAKVFFEDGTVTYDALTGSVLKNTRESGSTREYVTLDFKKLQGSGSGYPFVFGDDSKIAEISVCSIAKGKGETNSIKYLKNDFTIDTFFPNGLSATTAQYGSYARGSKYDEGGRVFTSDEIYLNDNKLSFEYEEDSDVIVTITQHHQGSSGMNLTLKMYRYDMFNDTLVEIGNNFAEWGYSLNSGRLAEMEQGDFESIDVITNYGIINSMTNNVGVYYDDNKKATFTASELKEKDFDIIINKIGTDPFQTDIGNIVTVVYKFSDGGQTAYKYLPYGEIKIADTRKGVMAMKPSGNKVTTTAGGDVFNAVDEETGDIVVSAKTLGYSDRDETYHSLFHIYEGCERTAYVSSGDFNLDGYTIPNYNPKKNYYVKVTSWKYYTGSDKNDKGYILWYKYNPTLKAWVKTVDTREQEEYTISIDSATFPEAVNLKDNHGTVYCGDEAILKFDNGDINKGNKNLSFKLNGFKSGNYKAEIMGLGYVFCGTNAELVNGTDEFGNNLGSEKNTVTIPVDFENGDGEMHDFTVDGKTEEGKEYHGEFKADNTADIEINLPDGEYDIIRDDGMFEHVVIDRDDSQKTDGSIGDKNSEDNNGTYNSDGDKTFKDTNGNDVPVDKVIEAETPMFSFEPYVYKIYSIEKPDGSEKVTGEIKGESLEKLSDIDEKLPEAVYYNFETQTGVINSKEEDSITTEDGYLTVDNKKGTLDKFNLEKGDINLDGKIGVSDLVLAQKYLLNGLDNKTTFTLKNYVAMDICVDESADVFDMVELRKAVINAIG